MWRSRARLGLCAIVVALAWPVAAAPASGSTIQPDAGTLQVTPLTVQASTETRLTFSFTAPANPPPTHALVVTMSMPMDWTALPPSSSDLSCSNSGCSLVATSSTQFAVELFLNLATTFTLNVQATPPGYAGSASFTAFEQTRGGPYVTGEVTAPPVAVTCPADGLGTMNVDPSTAPAGSSRTFTFTYTAGSCGAGAGGVIAVTVPQGWTPPSTVQGAGFATWAGSPSVSVSRSMITVPVGNLEQGTMISFEYEMAQAPAASGSYPFAAGQSGAGGPLQQLASPPVVMVTPVQGTTTPTQGTTTPTQGTTTPTQGTTTPPPARGAGTMTVTPSRVTASRPSTLRFTYTAAGAGLSSSGEVTVLVPAGWTAPSRSPGQAGYVSTGRGQLTVSGRRITVTGVILRRGQQLAITYAGGTAPGAAGVVTFLTSEGPDGTATLAALRVSPSVDIAPPGGAHGQPINWPPIILLVIGVLLAAGTAGRPAFRWLRQALRRLGHDRHGAVPTDVRTVPHTGPPTTVVVRDTGRGPALTVRIEPHASAAVTTIEETPP